MLGLWLENETLDVRDDIPDPARDGEALVRVTQAGICSTDSGLISGLYPFTGVLGHEFVGMVEDGPSDIVGKRVVGEINAVCGRCPNCASGRSKHCGNRTVLGIVGRDGAFAEHLSLPVANLHQVPDQISDDAAVFTEPLAAALEILEQVKMGAGDKVLVVGPGKLGHLICRVLALTGASVTAMGRGEEKLKRLEAYVAETVTDAVPERSFDIAVECTGNPDGFATALAALRPKGTLVLKSTYPGALTIDAAPVVVDEIKIVGSRCGPFDKALALLSSGDFDPTELIDARYSLGDGLAAFAKDAEPGIMKVLLEMK